MEAYVSPISGSQYADSNFTDALRAAFRYFDSSDDIMDISHRGKWHMNNTKPKTMDQRGQ